MLTTSVNVRRGSPTRPRSGVPDLYLLCEIDIPWIADGVRDRGHMRDAMQKLFVDAVVASGVPFALVTGVGDVRFERAVEAIDALLLSDSDCDRESSIAMSSEPQLSRER